MKIKLLFIIVLSMLFSCFNPVNKNIIVKKETIAYSKPTKLDSLTIMEKEQYIQYLYYNFRNNIPKVPIRYIIISNILKEYAYIDTVNSKYHKPYIWFNTKKDAINSCIYYEIITQRDSLNLLKDKIRYNYPILIDKNLLY